MENTAKYEFTGETRIVKNNSSEHEVKRIRALKGFKPPTMLDEVNIGDLGGWIEKENNLSQDGLCWVDENAVVIESAVVKDDAYVCGNAVICENAVICRFGTVDENAFVGGNSIISDKATVFERAKISGYVTIKGNVEVRGLACLIGLNEENRTVIDGDIIIFSSLGIKKWDVKICSRKIIENHSDIGLPQNNAVISFYDPNRYNNDKNYKLVDYSEKADSVLYIPLDDFQTELPEAEKIAEFVYFAESKELQIICQCESGQNRSAGCAAAILEHFNHSGDFILNNHRYHPDEMVYYAVLDALEVFGDNK